MCRSDIPVEFLDHPQLLYKIEDNAATTDDGYQWFYEGRNGKNSFAYRRHTKKKPKWKPPYSIYPYFECFRSYSARTPSHTWFDRWLVEIRQSLLGRIRGSPTQWPCIGRAHAMRHSVHRQPGRYGAVQQGQSVAQTSNQTRACRHFTGQRSGWVVEPSAEIPKCFTSIKCRNYSK